MTIIAAITRDNALGSNGDMLYHISADLKRFKSITMGHPLVMGRKTFESFPKGPLPGRRNCVITRNPHYQHDGIEVYDSLEAALAACLDPMIIGGGEIYRLAMPLADKLLITEIDATAPDADTYFPAINPDEWEITTVSEWETDPRSGVRFRFVDFSRKSFLTSQKNH